MVLRAYPMPIERWRVIPGFPRYEVSDTGRVRGPHGVMTPRIHPRGYLRVNLFGQHGVRRTFLIHRLMLEAFVGPRPPGMECRHLNGRKTDNRLSNLCWGTTKENVADAIRHGQRPDNRGERNGRAKLTVEAVREIRAASSTLVSSLGLARKFGVSIDAIEHVRSRRRWAHVA